MGFMNIHTELWLATHEDFKLPKRKLVTPNDLVRYREVYGMEPDELDLVAAMEYNNDYWELNSSPFALASSI